MGAGRDAGAGGGRDGSAGDAGRGTGGGAATAGDGGARGGSAGSAGFAGSAGIGNECPEAATYLEPGCTFAPAPMEGCYASCADEPCAEGECLYVSVPTPYDDDFIPPGATCGERRPLCVDAPLCVAGTGPTWSYVDEGTNLEVLRLSIDGREPRKGGLRLDDATSGTIEEVCVVELPPCAGDDVDLDDVNRKMADPAVQPMLVSGDLYGSPTNGGSLLRIRGDRSFVEVGEPCDDRDGCRAIEPKLAELVAVLRSLTEMALADERCANAPQLP